MRRQTTILALTALAVTGGCHRSTRPAPARTTPVVPADAAMPAMAPTPMAEPVRERHGYTEADVHFMQAMIAHHGQALTMTALVPTRTASDAVRLIAERIATSQTSEIAQMRHWLEARHEQVPAGDMAGMHDMSSDMGGMHHDMAGMAHDSSGMATMMPGMLTPAGLAQLAQTTGAAFDQLFLRDMIRHHEGALTMVARLFATTGAGQDAELFQLASDVDSGQRAEIARMAAEITNPP